MLRGDEVNLDNVREAWMRTQISVALCGANGYGLYYVKELLAGASAHQVRFVAAVNRSEPKMKSELETAGVQIFKSLDAMYNSGVKPDFVILSTSIASHREQTEFCLSKGSHVLCEKPVAATIEDAFAMQAAADKAGLILSIGYQWCFNLAIQVLKQRVLSGDLGRPLCLKTLVHWPRTDAYYKRNSWAGAVNDENGALVLDSPVMNAAAHYLQNALYVLGATVDTSAEVRHMEAELYRAYPIQNYDTAALRMKVNDGVPVLFYATHAALKFVGPMFCYRFEKASVYFADYNSNEGLTDPDGMRFNTGIVVRYRDGRVENLGNPWDHAEDKIWQLADAVRSGGGSLCNAKGATPHLEAVLAAQRFPIKTFRDSQIVQTVQPNGAIQRWVPGLENLFHTSYDQEVMPSELVPAV
jgi:predicted dehydrogenase